MGIRLVAIAPGRACRAFVCFSPGKINEVCPAFIIPALFAENITGVACVEILR
jgi:hypothetical protein